jgi:hypothetical protein
MGKSNELIDRIDFDVDSVLYHYRKRSVEGSIKFKIETNVSLLTIIYLAGYFNSI